MDQLLERLEDLSAEMETAALDGIISDSQLSKLSHRLTRITMACTTARSSVDISCGDREPERDRMDSNLISNKMEEFMARLQSMRRSTDIEGLDEGEECNEVKTEEELPSTRTEVLASRSSAEEAAVPRSRSRPSREPLPKKASKQDSQILSEARLQLLQKNCEMSQLDDMMKHLVDKDAEALSAKAYEIELAEARQQLSLKDSEVSRLQGMIRNLSQRESVGTPYARELADSRQQIERQSAEISRLQDMVQSLLQRENEMARLQELVQSLGRQLHDRDRRDAEISQFRRDEEATLQRANAVEVLRNGTSRRLTNGQFVRADHTVVPALSATGSSQEKSLEDNSCTVTATLTIPSMALSEEAGTTSQLSFQSGEAEAVAREMKASSDLMLELSRSMQGQTLDLLSYSEKLQPTATPKSYSSPRNKSPQQDGVPQEGFFIFQAEALRNERDSAISSAAKLRTELAHQSSESTRLAHELQLERSTTKEAEVRYRMLWREKQELSNRVQNLYRNMESLVAVTTQS